MAKKKKTKKPTGKSHLQFEITSGMDLPEVIDWQEDEVMDALSSYFKQRIRDGVRYVSMAEILKLFGHDPEPKHHQQIFEIADIGERDDPNNDYESYYGITHNGTFYPMISDSVH